jgi:hypothetical protein
VNLKRIVSATAIVALVGASTLGIGAGASAADTGNPNNGTSRIQSVDWHGRAPGMATAIGTEGAAFRGGTRSTGAGTGD